MAATVTNPWGKPGAWALDSEEHEDELKQEQTPYPINGNGQTPATEISDFPDLTTAAATKTKKKKGQTLSLGEFVTGSTNKPKAQSNQAAKGLTAEDMMMLPTGPRERTAEELDRSRLGGGFRPHDSSNLRWGSNRSGGGNEEGRSTTREPSGPSRADEIDDWVAAKKPAAGGGGFDRKEKGVGFSETSHSRADESDRWVSNKTYTPSEGRRNTGFESSGGANSSDNWGKKKEGEGWRLGGGSGGAFDSLRDRRGGNECSDNWGRKKEEGGGVGSMSRPKLNLQPRKVPIGSGEAVASAAVVVEKPNKGLNPFGDARPREQVLKEKGQDWKEIAEKLGSMNRSNDERSWRKNEAIVDVLPQSGDAIKKGLIEEEKDAQV